MPVTRAILFDVGGTLVDGGLPWYDLYRQALTLARHPLDYRPMVVAYESAIRRLMHGRQAAVVGEQTRRQLSLTGLLAEELGLKPERLQCAMDEALFDHPEARHQTCAPGVAEILQRLRRRGYRLGVVSNWSADLPRVLGQLGLREFFDGIFASETLGHAKPSPQALLIPLEKLGVKPAEAAYVGDLYDVDVAAARAAGVTAVLYDPLSLGLHPDVTTIAALGQLLDIFTGVGDPRPAVSQPRPRQ